MLVIIILPMPNPPIGVDGPYLVTSVATLYYVKSGSVFSFYSALFEHFSVVSSNV